MLWNTVKTFDTAIEAHLYKAKLESENIRVFLKDEYTISTNLLYNQAIGGVKLQVYQQDISRAIEIINSLDSSKSTAADNKVICCPKCNSTDLHNGFKSMKGIKGILSAIVSFALLIFPIYYKNVHKCKACNFEFKM